MAGAGFVLGLAEFCSAAWALELGEVESVLGLGAAGADLLDVYFGLVWGILILGVGLRRMRGTRSQLACQAAARSNQSNGLVRL